MRSNIDILKYWIKELRRVKEFQEIAKVENIEFERLYGATARALSNFFIETADEYGISRLEKITGIYPEPEDTLEKRRAQLYVYWNDKEPYTEENLRSRLEILCGTGNFEINTDYPNFWIQVITNVGGYGIFDEVTRMLDYFLPANLVLDLQNLIKGQTSASIYYGVGTVNAIEYTITNDVTVEYSFEQGVYVARPVITASDVTLTNDINSENQVNEDTTWFGNGWLSKTGKSAGELYQEYHFNNKGKNIAKDDLIKLDFSDLGESIEGKGSGGRALTNFKGWLKEHKKASIITGGAVLLAGLGYAGYKGGWLSPKFAPEEECGKKPGYLSRVI